MIDIKKAKEIKGTVSLPPSPDLLFLSLALLAKAPQKAVIKSIEATPLVNSILSTFKKHLKIYYKNNDIVIDALPETSSFILFDYEYIPYVNFVVAMFLAMGKTVAFKNISNKKLNYWILTFEELGVDIENVEFEDSVVDTKGLKLTSSSRFSVDRINISESNIYYILGLTAGLSTGAEFEIDFTFLSPLRSIIPFVGFVFELSSTSENKNTDPLARRIAFMRKKKNISNKKQTFSITCDFSSFQFSESVLEIVLPGDELLGSFWVLAGALVNRGQLFIENFLLESWASPVVATIKKISSAIITQKQGISIYGQIGILSLKPLTLLGRKTDCVPVENYVSHIAMLVVLANYSKTQSVLRGLSELREDEPDKIELLLSLVRTMGGRHGKLVDGFVIDGTKLFDGFDVSNEYSPEISAAIIAAALCSNGTSIVNENKILERWPDFIRTISEVVVYRTGK